MVIIEKIAVGFNRWRYKSAPISLCRAISEPGKILVSLPMRFSDLPLCYEIVEFLKNKTTKRNLKFVTAWLPVGKILTMLYGYNLDYPKIDQPIKHNLPNKEFVRKVASFKPNIAVDLDPKPGAYSSMLLLKSGAAVRIGFQGGIGMPFFNIEIKPEAGAVPEKRYEDLLRFLMLILDERCDQGRPVAGPALERDQSALED
jgi:hypothetical protein